MNLPKTFGQIWEISLIGSDLRCNVSADVQVCSNLPACSGSLTRRSKMDCGGGRKSKKVEALIVPAPFSRDNSYQLWQLLLIVTASLFSTLFCVNGFILVLIALKAIKSPRQSSCWQWHPTFNRKLQKVQTSHLLGTEAVWPMCTLWSDSGPSVLSCFHQT